MHTDTVRKAFRELVQAGLLTAQYRSEMTTLYRVNHHKVINEPLRKGGSTLSGKQGDQTSTNNGVPPSEKRGGDPSEKQGDKVYPTKSIPLSKSPSNMKMSRNVEVIALGKSIDRKEKEIKEYKERNHNEYTSPQWAPGTKEKYLEMRKNFEDMKQKQDSILMAP